MKQEKQRAPQRKCYNCKHASAAFKIADKTHYQCCHPKHALGLANGNLTAWDTLQEWYNTCKDHEPKEAKQCNTL